MHINRVIQPAVLFGPVCPNAVADGDNNRLQTVHDRQIAIQQAVIVFEGLAAVGEIKGLW